MTTLQKNNSCPGNERADFNYRKKWGRGIATFLTSFVFL